MLNMIKNVIEESMKIGQETADMITSTTEPVELSDEAMDDVSGGSMLLLCSRLFRRHQE